MEIKNLEVITCEEIDIWMVGTGDRVDNRKFFDNEASAEEFSDALGPFGSVEGVKRSSAMRLSDGRVLLCQKEPIRISSNCDEELRNIALSKLTTPEKRALGFGSSVDSRDDDAVRKVA